MILDELVLHNFGVYRGRQSVELTPPKSSTPIVLFGGLNGGGKTTILDALQLALYGRLANCSNRNGQAYEKFLESSIHKDAGAAEGAAIELMFHRKEEGKKHWYRVHRSWVRVGAGVREHVEVLRDGHKDDVLSETWQEQVEEFLPSRIAPLFFFDGEKIEALADLDNSRELLGTAIRSLLGIDLVDRLKLDLAVLEKRTRQALQSEEDQEVTRALEDEVRRANQVVDDLLGRRGSVKNGLDRTERQLHDVDQRFREQGGELFRARTDLELERSRTKAEIESVEDRLRDVAAESAPFVLVKDLLVELDRQDRIEEEAKSQAILLEALSKRDQELLAFAEIQGASRTLLGGLEGKLRQDRAERTKKVKGDRYLHLTHHASSELRRLLNGGLDEVSELVQRLLEEHRKLDARQVDLERRLEGAPAEEAVLATIQERQDLRSKAESERSTLKAIDGELHTAQNIREQVQKRLTNHLQKQVRADFDDEDKQRILQYSTRARSTLASFHQEILQRHLTRIEAFILEAYTSLLRKKSLIGRVRISPETFEVSLFNPSDDPVDPKRLSAGERQLLAVSILWGLAKASGYSLPVVIDTPLGRLDASHRENLVKHYFPKASQQVLLLSTDEEIDDRFYEALKGSVGHEYCLSFDDRTRSTTIDRGYLWNTP